MPSKLSSDKLSAALKDLNGWSTDGKQISKTFPFKNYYETMAFVNAVAYVAHQADHHPDLSVHYNKAVVAFSTHDAGGVTALDVENARKVDGLVA
jgi:4a-hydroxytetrahydrobiopterin dehydratase